jgi:hypothetical protein
VNRICIPSTRAGLAPTSRDVLSSIISSVNLSSCSRDGDSWAEDEEELGKEMEFNSVIAQYIYIAYIVHIMTDNRIENTV